jgi:hypothetical protein
MKLLSLTLHVLPLLIMLEFLRCIIGMSEHARRAHENVVRLGSLEHCEINNCQSLCEANAPALGLLLLLCVAGLVAMGTDEWMK